MKMITKATSDGIGYASKSDYEYEGTQYKADIKSGDIVTILNGGTIEPSQFGEQHYFKIMTRNGEKKTPFNQTTINVLVAEIGDESEEWIGKKVNVITKKDTIAGKKVTIAYFITGDWEMDEYGAIAKPSPSVIPTFTPRTENQQAVEDIRNQEIRPEDIPFN
jgi:hypothetical protein